MLDIFEEWQQLNQLFENEQKQLLMESPWADGGSFKGHYEKHVLRVGEAYIDTEPKFKHSLTPEEYKEAALDLANSVAGTSDMRWVSVIGWEAIPDKNILDKSKRCYVKVRRKALSKLMPKDAFGLKFPMEFVVFNCSKNVKFENIQSYYLITEQSFKNKLKEKIGELPENASCTNKS